jgi:two-component system NarL family sensor kinase
MNGLETHFLTHFFRLQRLERSLWARAQSRRKLGRGQIVRQLERERTRISQELHTGVGQMLAAIRLQLELAAANLPDPAEGVRRSLEHIGALVAGVLEQVRAISKRLHPPEWQRLKLETALEQLWELSGMERSFEGAIRLEPLPAELAQEIKTLLYRAAQEAISNVMRHSRATRVQMTLQASDGDAVLTVEDNGKGFDAEAQLSAPPSIASGIGLRSIREQAEALRGKLEIRSSDSGTTLEIRAPLAAMER